MGAPLVTPGAGTAQWNARERNSARKRQIVASARPGEPRGTPSGHPGDMNVAPTVAKQIRRGKRRGATCDARNPAALRPSSGRHECRPYVAKQIRRGKRGGATCDARCRHGAMKRPRTASSRASGCEGTKVPRTGGFFCMCVMRPIPAASARPGEPHSPRPVIRPVIRAT